MKTSKTYAFRLFDKKVIRALEADARKESLTGEKGNESVVIRRIIHGYYDQLKVDRPS